MSDLVTAPFTADQVASLNAYQTADDFHPFTCGTEGCRDAEGSRHVLVAAADGWHCRHCDYGQNWAHGWMADWRWNGWGAIAPPPGEGG